VPRKCAVRDASQVFFSECQIFRDGKDPYPIDSGFFLPPTPLEGKGLDAVAGGSEKACAPAVRLVAGSESLDRDGPDYGRRTALLHFAVVAP